MSSSESSSDDDAPQFKKNIKFKRGIRRVNSNSNSNQTHSVETATNVNTKTQIQGPAQSSTSLFSDMDAYTEEEKALEYSHWKQREIERLKRDRLERLQREEQD